MSDKGFHHMQEKLRALQADITTLAVDVIVNAANVFFRTSEASLRPASSQGG